MVELFGLLRPHTGSMKISASLALIALPSVSSKCSCPSKNWVDGKQGSWCRPGGKFALGNATSLDSCLSFCADKGSSSSSCCMFQQADGKNFFDTTCSWMDLSASYDGIGYDGGACFGQIQCTKDQPLELEGARRRNPQGPRRRGRRRRAPHGTDCDPGPEGKRACACICQSDAECGSNCPICRDYGPDLKICKRDQEEVYEDASKSGDKAKIAV